MGSDQQKDIDIIEEDANEMEEIETSSIDTSGIIVYSRDWTVETIISQINQNNFNIYPKFQRRNVWNDEKRSKLIDSLLHSYPIPEIIITENPTSKKSYIIIDGKQRLMTIMGYVQPEQYSFWDNPYLIHLEGYPELDGRTYKQLSIDTQRELSNSSIRCSVISNVTDNDFLYELFYRLNSGSVPLSLQELRQSLYHGGFSEYLFDITNRQDQPIHRVMRINGPDNRLKDIEYILRIMAIISNIEHYDGNLKVFLDDFMQVTNKSWSTSKEHVSRLYLEINNCLESLQTVLGDYGNIGRQYINKSFTRLNRVLFEVQVYYTAMIGYENFKSINSRSYLDKFELLCKDPGFLNSITSSTKNVGRYKIRYDKYSEMLSEILGKHISSPF